MATKIKGRVTKGMKFRSAYADSNALWEVIESRGRGTWLCEIVNEPIEIDGKIYDSDYAGVQKAFLREDILRSVAMANLFETKRQETDDFYANLTVGDIYHYDNGFQNYVRCEVVQEDTEYKLKPIALVGNWRSHDLPRRYRNGDIYYGYYPSKILGKPMSDGKVETTFTPNESCIWECSRKGDDPREMNPLDLSLPDLNPEEQATADKWKLIDTIQRICGENNHNDPQDVLNEIKALL